jgi:hypothetical protein
MSPLGVLRIATVALAAAMPACALAAVTLRAPSVQAAAGGTVEVPIVMTGASGIGALQLELAFDAGVVRVESVVRGTLAGANALLEFNAEPPGRLGIAIATLDDLKGDGPIALARFKVVGQPGLTTVLAIRTGEAWEGASRQPVEVEMESGSLIVTSAAIAWWLWLLGAVALIALLGVLVFALRRRRPRPAPVAEPVAVPVAAPVAAPPAGRPGPYCSRCGQKNDDDARFCVQCGQALRA